MSSGVAMNRKIQREGGNSSMANLATKNGRGVNENMTQSGTHPRVALRQQNKTQQKGSPIKHLKGTPSQKNWYLLSVHEQRLNRLEAWAQMMMKKNHRLDSNDADTAVHQQQEPPKQEPPKQAPALSRGNTQKIQRSKVVTLEVNETNT